MTHLSGHTVPMNINIALTGFIPESCSEEQIMKRINHIIDRIVATASQYNGRRFGYNEEIIRVNILSSPSVAGRFAVESFFRPGAGRLICVMPYVTDRVGDVSEIAAQFMAVADSVIQLDLDRLFPQMAKLRIMKWMLDQSDIAVVLWDGREGSDNGDQWTMLQTAREKELPCIWGHTEKPAEYWTQKGYFEELSPDYLDRYLKDLLGLNDSKRDYLTAPDGAADRRKPWWQWFYRHFIKVNKIVREPEPPDPLMKAERSGLTVSESANQARLELLDFYSRADGEAVYNAASGRL